MNIHELYRVVKIAVIDVELIRIKARHDECRDHEEKSLLRKEYDALKAESDKLQ